MAPPQINNGSKNGRLPLYLTAGLIITVIAAGILIPAARAFFANAWDVLSSGDQDRIHQWVGTFGAYGPFVIIAAMVVQMFLLIIPTVLLMLVAILAYGPVWGSAIALTAVAVASTAAYALGRYLEKNTLSRLIGEGTGKKLSAYLEDYGFWAVFMTRLNPFLSNDAISLIAGFLRMGYPKFMGATLLGISPLIIIIAIVNKSSGPWKTILFWCSLSGFILLGLYIWLDRRRKGRNKLQ